MTNAPRAHTWRKRSRRPFGYASTIAGHQVTVYAERLEDETRWYLELRKGGELVRERTEHGGPWEGIAAAEEFLRAAELQELDVLAGGGSQPATGRDRRETSRADNLRGVHP